MGGRTGERARERERERGGRRMRRKACDFTRGGSVWDTHTHVGLRDVATWRVSEVTTWVLRAQFKKKREKKKTKTERHLMKEDGFFFSLLLSSSLSLSLVLSGVLFYMCSWLTARRERAEMTRRARKKKRGRERGKEGLVRASTEGREKRQRLTHTRKTGMQMAAAAKRIFSLHAR
jgi:hypothetical protein